MGTIQLAMRKDDGTLDREAILSRLRSRQACANANAVAARRHSYLEALGGDTNKVQLGHIKELLASGASASDVSAELLLPMTDIVLRAVHAGLLPRSDLAAAAACTAPSARMLSALSSFEMNYSGSVEDRMACRLLSKDHSCRNRAKKELEQAISAYGRPATAHESWTSYGKVYRSAAAFARNRTVFNDRLTKVVKMMAEGERSTSAFAVELGVRMEEASLLVSTALELGMVGDRRALEYRTYGPSYNTRLPPPDAVAMLAAGLDTGAVALMTGLPAGRVYDAARVASASAAEDRRDGDLRYEMLRPEVLLREELRGRLGEHVLDAILMDPSQAHSRVPTCMAAYRSARERWPDMPARAWPITWHIGRHAVEALRRQEAFDNRFIRALRWAYA